MNQGTPGQLTIRDARLIFRNFAGKEDQYNREGNRNFCVLLDEENAVAMEQDGWNVKALKSREEGDPEQPYIQVSVSYKVRPPRIVMITSKGRTDLDEEAVDMFDWADIKKADLIVVPYNWTVGAKSGIKAYLKSLFVTIEEDELELEYRDIDEIPTRSGKVEE